MANLSTFSVTLGATDYPVKYAGLLAYVEPYLTNLENFSFPGGENVTLAGTFSATKLIPTGGSATGNGMYLPATNTLAWSNNNTERMRLDSSGNLGIGTSSPNAKLQVAGVIRAEATGGEGGHIEFMNVANNAVHTLLDVGSTDVARLFTIGSHSVTFGTNSSERARIDSSGNLLINATATTGFFDGKLNVLGRIHTKLTAWNEANYVWNEATSNDNNFFIFGTESTYASRGSIIYNRASGLVSYNTTSDYRAKDILGPVANPGATIDALKVYEGRMKGATLSRPMLVAHEAQEHVPYAVIGVKDEENEDGTPKLQQMDHASMVPLVIAELQALRARVAALEAA